MTEHVNTVGSKQAESAGGSDRKAANKLARNVNELVAAIDPKVQESRAMDTETNVEKEPADLQDGEGNVVNTDSPNTDLARALDSISSETVEGITNQDYVNLANLLKKASKEEAVSVLKFINRESGMAHAAVPAVAPAAVSSLQQVAQPLSQSQEAAPVAPPAQETSQGSQELNKQLKELTAQVANLTKQLETLREENKRLKNSVPETTQTQETSASAHLGSADAYKATVVNKVAEHYGVDAKKIEGKGVWGARLRGFGRAVARITVAKTAAIGAGFAVGALTGGTALPVLAMLGSAFGASWATGKLMEDGKLADDAIRTRHTLDKRVDKLKRLGGVQDARTIDDNIKNIEKWQKRRSLGYSLLFGLAGAGLAYDHNHGYEHIKSGYAGARDWLFGFFGDGGSLVTAPTLCPPVPAPDCINAIDAIVPHIEETVDTPLLMPSDVGANGVDTPSDWNNGSSEVADRDVTETYVAEVSTVDPLENFSFATDIGNYSTDGYVDLGQGHGMWSDDGGIIRLHKGTPEYGIYKLISTAESLVPDIELSKSHEGLLAQLFVHYADVPNNVQPGNIDFTKIIANAKVDEIVDVINRDPSGGWNIGGDKNEAMEFVKAFVKAAKAKI